MSGGIWWGLALLIGLQWVARIAIVSHGLRRRQILTVRSYDGPPQPAPRLSMLVAAKDEEDNIEACVRSLLAQDYPNLEVIAIDDRSGDRTPQILSRLSLEFGGRLRVISIEALRAGWFGKNNAMREGVEASSGEWLCFTDADCRMLESNTLSMAVREAVEQEIDFLTLTPVLETHTLWEKLTQPACAQIMLAWFRPALVNDPRSRKAYANGAFMLMSRYCYEFIGGHAAVRTEVNEDIHLARLAKGAGFRLQMLENDHLYHTRMYRNVRESWRGWSRIFFGSLRDSWRLSLSMFSILLFTLFPWLALGIAISERLTATGGEAGDANRLIAAWAVVIFLSQLNAWLFYKVLTLSRWWSLTMIAGQSAVLGMLANALFKQFGVQRTTWRGTTYLGDCRVDAPAAPVTTGTTAD